jgi:hypothetical protein
MSENVGASTSRNSKGLHGLYKGNFTFMVTDGNMEQHALITGSTNSAGSWFSNKSLYRQLPFSQQKKKKKKKKKKFY